MNKLVLFLIIVLLWSCSENNTDRNKIKYLENSQYLRVPFDTDAVISSLKIKDSLNLLALFIKESKSNLKLKYDTIDLVYMAYACDCPNWLEYNEFVKKNYTGSSPNSYYIEAADTNLFLDSRLFVGGNIVRFIGREYKENCYPENVKFQDPNPAKGKVLRYYSYKFIRPFKVWGPKILDSTDESSFDTISYATKLTIK